MIAPPGRPNTSVMPSFSSAARMAPEPVSMGGSLFLAALADDDAAALGTGLDSVVMMESFLGSEWSRQD